MIPAPLEGSDHLHEGEQNTGHLQGRNGEGTQNRGLNAKVNNKSKWIRKKVKVGESLPYFGFPYLAPLDEDLISAGVQVTMCSYFM